MKTRLVFLDLLRGWATLVMIEVHVFNAFILPEFKEAGWFTVLNFINGLVAPSFLFVSGFVFVTASERKLEEFRAFGQAFWKQFGRIVLIWFVGYTLHLPFFSFTRTVNETTEEGWLKFYQVDILHCIAAGLLILFLARIFLKDEKTFQRFVFGAGLVSVLVAPFLWEVDFVRYFSGPIAAYVNGQHYSQFPLFNWLGFMMFGGLAAMTYRSAKEQQRERDHIRFLITLGIGLILAGSIIIELPLRVPFVSMAIRANPLFFATRLGIVLLLAVLCWFYAEERKTERSFVLDVSRESLLVYAAHLLVIYGQFWNDHSLSFLYGKTFPVAQCVAATLALMLLLVTMAKAWGWLKQRSIPMARAFSYATAFVVLILFFIRET